MNTAANLKFNPVGDLFNAAYVVQFNSATHKQPGACRAFCVKLPVSSVPMKPERVKYIARTTGSGIFRNGHDTRSTCASILDTLVADVVLNIEDCEDGTVFDDQSPDVETAEYFEDVELDLP